jgi:hypothetical protein
MCINFSVNNWVVCITFCITTSDTYNLCIRKFVEWRKRGKKGNVWGRHTWDVRNPGGSRARHKRPPNWFLAPLHYMEILASPNWHLLFHGMAKREEITSIYRCSWSLWCFHVATTTLFHTKYLTLEHSLLSYHINVYF